MTRKKKIKLLVANLFSFSLNVEYTHILLIIDDYSPSGPVHSYPDILKTDIIFFFSLFNPSIHMQTACLGTKSAGFENGPRGGDV